MKAAVVGVRRGMRWNGSVEQCLRFDGVGGRG